MRNLLLKTHPLGAKGESSGVFSDNRFDHCNKHIVTTELAIAISHQDIGGT